MPGAQAAAPERGGRSRNRFGKTKLTTDRHSTALLSAGSAARTEEANTELSAASRRAGRASAGSRRARAAVAAASAPRASAPCRLPASGASTAAQRHRSASGTAPAEAHAAA